MNNYETSIAIILKRNNRGSQVIIQLDDIKIIYFMIQYNYFIYSSNFSNKLNS